MPGTDELGYLGRYQQGEELPLVVQCDTAGAAASWPLVAPVVSVFNPAGTLVLTRVLAADLQGVTVGLFRLPQFLGADFSTAGTYRLAVRYKDAGSNPRTLCGTFRLMAGGHADGAVVSLRPVRRPNANYLVYQTDGGRLARGRNPR